MKEKNSCLDQNNTIFEPDRAVYNFDNSKSVRIVLNNKYGRHPSDAYAQPQHGETCLEPQFSHIGFNQANRFDA